MSCDKCGTPFHYGICYSCGNRDPDYVNPVRLIGYHSDSNIRANLKRLNKPTRKTKTPTEKQPKGVKRKVISKAKREFIMSRDENRCLKCGSEKNLTIDHINPLVLGGTNKLSNLQTLCFVCNHHKGIKVVDYRKFSAATVIRQELTPE